MEILRARTRSNRKKDDEDDDSDLANPFGDTADLYQFGEPETVGSEIVVTFEPAPGHEDDDNVATGGWRGTPSRWNRAWMEMTAVHAPKPLKRLAIRLEFTLQGDDLFVSRMVTDGLAKVLMMQREFHMDLRFEDIRPDQVALRRDSDFPHAAFPRGCQAPPPHGTRCQAGRLPHKVVRQLEWTLPSRLPFHQPAWRDVMDRFEIRIPKSEFRIS